MGLRSYPADESCAQTVSALGAMRERAADVHLPLQVLWEVTQRCPQKCRHCYLSGKWEKDELTTDEAKELLKQMASLGVLFLGLTGGEPLLRDDLYEIIDEALSLGFAWKLLTSAVLVDDRHAQEITGRHPINIDVSVHGLEETHEMMTGVPGSFQAAMDGIRRLRNLGVHVIAKMNLTPQGVKDVPALREELAGMDVKLSVATAMLPDFDGKLVDEELCVSESELSEYYAELNRELGRSFGRHPELSGNEPLCNAGRSTFAVSPSGDVRACISLRRVCGNVRQTPLREIWESPAMMAAENLVAGNRSECEGCADAEYCYFCPGLAEAERGNPLLAFPSACRRARILHQLDEKRLEAKEETCQCER